MSELKELEQEQTPTQRRRHPRIELPKGMLVAWQGAGHREVGRISSLSMGGIFVPTPDPPAEGALLQLVFEIPGGDVRARGSVVQVQPGKGMGIQFRGMGFEARARLARLLKRLLQ